MVRTALIMCGGFAKRMWPLTENTPKALLEVSGKPIINYILEKLDKNSDIKKIYISINKKFEPNFLEWIKTLRAGKDVKLVVEQSMNEEEKLGSIGALDFFIKTENFDDDLLIIGGDNLFEANIEDLIDFHLTKKAPVLCLFDLRNRKRAKRFGVVSLDANKKITSLMEKPENPESTLVSTCIYLLTKESLRNVDEYLNSGNSRDAFGHFLSWLSKKTDMYGLTIGGNWFDIGSFESFDAAKEKYKNIKG